tara:strand:+ start:5129 stop:6184 length:1056 start_codon:yes stop_codon:yes gene_type:complete
MDAKLLATIIAIAKKESGAKDRDLSLLERKVEDKLKEFHKRSPILDLPSFAVKNGCLYCTWSSGLVLDFGNVVGPQGPQGIQGTQGPQGVVGKDGTSGKDGLNGKDGENGKDGAAAEAGRDGVDGKQGLTGAVGPLGESGQAGKQGVPGKDGKDAEKGAQGLPGLNGYDGVDGVSVEKAWVDGKYHLTLRLDSGKVIDAGYVRGPAGASAGKGGRVTGSYSGGGSGSNFYVTGATYNEAGELVITNSNGSTINAGSQAQALSKTGIAELDFGASNKTTSVVVEGVGLVVQNSVVLASMRVEETEDHPVDDLLVDPIRVAISSLVVGTGFTVHGTMDNATANGKYKVEWALV